VRTLVSWQPPSAREGRDHRQRCRTCRSTGSAAGCDLRGRNHEHGAVGMVEHRARNATEHQRLHARQSSGAEDDDLGLQIGRHAKNRFRDVALSLNNPRPRGEPGGSSPLRAFGCTVKRRLLGRCVERLIVAIRPGESEAHAQRAVAGHRVQNPLPDDQHRRDAARHQLCGAVDRSPRVSRPVVANHNHRVISRSRARAGALASEPPLTDGGGRVGVCVAGATVPSFGRKRRRVCVSAA
jgi:hypothetical protein